MYTEVFLSGALRGIPAEGVSGRLALDPIAAVILERSDRIQGDRRARLQAGGGFPLPLSVRVGGGRACFPEHLSEKWVASKPIPNFNNISMS